MNDSKKLKILVFLNYYLPGYKSGGPIRTIANLVDNLGEEFDFQIFTADRDSGDERSFQNIFVDTWQNVGKAKVFYSSPGPLNILKIRRIIDETNCEIVYLNSFFSFWFSILPLFLMKFGFAKKKKIILAPRGEFSEGALALKSLKKKIFICVSKMIGLHNGLKWHFSSEHEKEACIRIMGKERVLEFITASNMSPRIKMDLVDNEKVKTKGTPLRIIFLSRISPMKNLDYALKILKKLKCAVRFDIYGVIREENYWKECEKLISELPVNIKTEFKGSVENTEVISIIGKYDLFFLPTRGENFGHVIAESLSSGTPVLISDQTPWKDLDDEGAGWSIPLENEDFFVEKIERICEMANDQYLEMRKKVRIYANKKLKDENILEANKKVFYQ